MKTNLELAMKYFIQMYYYKGEKNTVSVLCLPASKSTDLTILSSKSFRKRKLSILT